MPRIPRYTAGLAGLLMLAILAGCVRKYYYPFSSHGPLPPGTRVLVEPIRVSDRLPKRFDEGLVVLLGLLRARLSAIDVVVLSQEETDLALAGLHPEGRNLYSPKTGRLLPERIAEERSRFLGALAERDVCDAVVTPTLLVRSA